MRVSALLTALTLVSSLIYQVVERTLLEIVATLNMLLWHEGWCIISAHINTQLREET